MEINIYNLDRDFTDGQAGDWAVEFRYGGAGITTCGGNADGALCKFPFNYEGITYHACTTQDHSEEWCYTTNPGKWGNCNCGCDSDSGDVWFSTLGSTYCSDNWGQEHAAHTVEADVRACELKCDDDPACLAMSFSAPEGGKCVLCKTSTATKSHPNWQFAIKPGVWPSTIGSTYDHYIYAITCIHIYMHTLHT